MKLKDLVSDQTFSDRLFEIPFENEVMLRVVSDFEFFAKHWDADKKRYFACIGKKNDCPYCPDDNITKRYIAYIKDEQNSIKMAALPYGLFSFLKTELENNPNKFDDNDLPEFYVKCFKSGKGKETTYSYEVDISDKTKVDISQLEPIESYIETQKFAAEVKNDAPMPTIETQSKQATIDDVVPF